MNGNPSGMAWGDGEMREERKTMKVCHLGNGSMRKQAMEDEDAGLFFQFPYRRHTFLFATIGNGTGEKKKQKSVWEETRLGSEN